MNIWLAEIWRAWRASLRRPGFLLLASGVLALGIGASVAVFTLIDQVLLKPLPVSQASQLVVLGRIAGNGNKVGSATPKQYQALASLSGVQAIGLTEPFQVANIAGGGPPLQVPALYIDRDLLPTLGVSLQLGRNFSQREDSPHGPKSVILSHGFWERRYGGRPDVIGKRLAVEGVARTIVGVLPASFALFGNNADIVLPTTLPTTSSDDTANYFIIARLASGASMASVAAETNARLHALYVGTDDTHWKKVHFGAQGYGDWLRAGRRPVLRLFVASALFVLLIALVNLTNLMLLRALGRSHDGAIRDALGAPRLRLVLPTLAEGLLVGLGGALMGLALAALGLRTLQPYVPDSWLPKGGLTLTGGGVLLAVALGFVATLLAALLGLWRSRNAIGAEVLREGGRSGLSAGSGRVSKLLVVIQVMLASVLLCGAGLFLHTLYQAARTPLGFASDHILTFELSPVRATYPDPAAVHTLSRRLVERLRAQPGVDRAVVVTNLPAGAAITTQLKLGALHAPGGKPFAAQYHGVGAGYFKLFDIGLRQGSGFTRRDVRGGEEVAVVNEALNKQRYGGQALGKVIEFGAGADLWSARIVGVVGDTHQFGPLDDSPPVVYVPFAQMPNGVMQAIRGIEPLRFALRVKGDPHGYRAMVHKVVTEVAPNQPITRIRDMVSIVNMTVARMHLNLLLVGLFACLSLLLAAAGMYAVVAVTVAAREREFGVRTALGASPVSLVQLVLRNGLVQTAVGLVLGVVAALLLSGILRAAVPQVGRLGLFDSLVIGGVCLVLIVTSLLACLVPALRAGRVQPMHALRGE